MPTTRPCPSCARHVRVSEAACPFCGASLDRSLQTTPAPLPPAARLSRAALFALGASTVSLAAACGGATVGADGPLPGEAGSAPSDGSDKRADVGTIAPPYGFMPLPVDAGADGPSLGPMYGGAVFPDSGADGPTDSGADGPVDGSPVSPPDAGSDGPRVSPADGAPPPRDAAVDVLVSLPPYGAPPPPP